MTKPALEEGGAEERIALVHLLGHLGDVHGHQADRLGEQRIGPRVADQAMAEGAAVERLMLAADRDQEMLGVEVLGREPAQPQGRVGQPGIELREHPVGDEAGRIDDHAAGGELRIEQILEHMIAREVGMLGRGHVDADRARELAVEIEPEDAHVREIVIRVGERAGRIGRDRAFPKVSLVAQAEDRFALLRRLGDAAVEPMQQLGDAVGEKILGFEARRRSRTGFSRRQRNSSRTHTQPPQSRRPQRENGINTLLTSMQP